MLIMFEFDTTATRTVWPPEADLPFEDEELPHAASVPATATTPITPAKTRQGPRLWKLRDFLLDS
jgi:hypothetical protein